MTDQTPAALPSPHRRATLVLRALLLLTAIVVGATCADSTGPAIRLDSQVALRPSFSPTANPSGVTLDLITIVVRKLGTPDTLLAHGAPWAIADSATPVVLPLELTSSTENVEVIIDLRHSGALRFTGRDTVTLEPSDVVPAATLIPMRYVGPGAQIASLEVQPRDTVMRLGESAMFRALALDSANAAVGEFVVSWSSAAAVALTQNGELTAPDARNTAWVRVRTPTGVTDSTLVRFVPAPVAIAKTAGDVQVTTVGDTLPAMLRVVVRGADSLPVPAATVTFAALDGGAVVTTTVVTDSIGVATTRAVLGTQAGVSRFTATVAGVPVTFTAIGVADIPTALTFVTAPPLATPSGAVIAPAPVVQLRDAYGNTVALEGVFVRAAMSGASSLSGLDSVATDTLGRARFDSLIVSGAPGADELRFEGAALALDAARSNITLLAGPPTSIAIVDGNTQEAYLDSLLAVNPRVRVADANDNPVAGATVTWRAIVGGGAASDSITSTDANGFSSVSWRLGSAEGAQSFVAIVPGVDTVEFSATAVAPPPAVVLQLQANVLGVGRSAPLAVRLTQPAGVGGVTVSLTSAAPSLATLEVDTLHIAEGDSLATTTINGIAAGAVGVVAAAVDHLADTLAVDVTNRVITVAATRTVPYRHDSTFVVQLGEPAPVGGVSITLRALPANGVFTMPTQVVFTAGETSKGVSMNAARPGVMSVVAEHPDYAADTSVLTSQATVNILQGGLTLYPGFPSVYVTELRSAGAAAPAPAGGFKVALTVRNAACAMPRLDSLHFNAGFGTPQDTVLAIDGGPFPCQTYLVAHGPGLLPDSVQLQIDEMPYLFVPFSLDVGSGLQNGQMVTLSTGSHFGRQVTARSLDPAVAVVQPDATTPGSDSATINAAHGTGTVHFRIAGMEGIVNDTTHVVVTAPGFKPDTMRIIVRAPQVAIANMPTTLNAFSRDTTVSAVLAAVGGAGGLQPLRAGGTLGTVATFIVTPDSVAAFYDSTGVRHDTIAVTFPPGSYQTPITGAARLWIDPLAAGTATLTVAVAGIAPAPASTRTLTVTEPAILAAVDTVRLESGTQSGPYTVSLSGTNHGGRTVVARLVASGVAQLKATAGATGTDSLELVFAQGSATGATFYVAGLDSLTGSAAIVLSSPGVKPDTVFVEVTAPLVLSGGAAAASARGNDAEAPSGFLDGNESEARRRTGLEHAAQDGDGLGPASHREMPLRDAVADGLHFERRRPAGEDGVLRNIAAEVQQQAVIGAVLDDVPVAADRREGRARDIHLA